jgi:tripartite-type tricarboxylate transporter receptor subunit TctC
MIRQFGLVALLFATHVGAGPAAADPIADFYHGKTMTLVVGFSPGGDYDLRLRMVGRYIARYIPGHPTVVVNNMPGGAGVVAANWLANVAPRDGTAILAITQNLPGVQAMNSTPGIKYDVRRFNWLGNTTDTPDVINAWYTTGIHSIKDVMERELVVGATATASGSYLYPHVLNLVAGTKFKIVTGYAGGNNINLAMERGEVGGRGSNSWASWKSTHPQWLAEHKIIILVQVGIKKNPELPDVPLMQDLAKNDMDRKVLAFLSAGTAISRPLVTTPDTPPERVEMLRRAFEATMKDPDFIAEAKKTKTDISPMTGPQAQAIAAATVATPRDVVERAKELSLAK